MLKISLSSVRDFIRDALAINPGRHEAAVAPVAPEPAGPPCGAEVVLVGSKWGHDGRPHVCLCTKGRAHNDAEDELEQYHRCGQVGGCGAVWLSIPLHDV